MVAGLCQTDGAKFITRFGGSLSASSMGADQEETYFRLFDKVTADFRTNRSASDKIIPVDDPVAWERVHSLLPCMSPSFRSGSGNGCKGSR